MTASRGRRMMARPPGQAGNLRSRLILSVGLTVAALVAVTVAAAMLAKSPGQLPASATAGGTTYPEATTSPAPPSPSAVPTIRSSPLPGVSPSPVIAPTATPSASPSPTAGPANSAPASAAEFDLIDQVIEIAFPLRPETRYHYRDNFREKRAGPPDDYNHAGLNGRGVPVRLHDGCDIYAAAGEPVISPFDGVVIDPSTRWTPWEFDRYGRTVVVVSSEPATAGYAAVLVHLDRSWVDVGQVISRGQVLGVLGRSGNAEEVAAQLHFELRAPFELDWSPLGEERLVDAFNPYLSLLAADPLQ